LFTNVRNAISCDDAYQQRLNDPSSEFIIYEHMLWKPVQGKPPVLYIPANIDLRTSLIKTMHASTWSGHLGFLKTFRNISRVFYWPGLRKDVRIFVSKCDICQRCKTSSALPAGLLQPLEIPSQRWEQVTLDFIMPLPRTTRNHDAICVFVDKFSKYAIFVPTRVTITAKGTAKLFLAHVFCFFGMPHSIVSDRDARFLSDFWLELFHLLDVRLCHSSAYHPQTDGQTERTNRTLLQMLRTCILESHSAWDELLPAMQFAYNNAVNESTGYSPFFLNYGYDPHVPLCLLNDSASRDISTLEAANGTCDTLRKALFNAKENLTKAVQRQKKYADQHRRDVMFTEDDYVLLSRKAVRGSSNISTDKFEARHYGPFKIIKVISPVTYKLDLRNRMNVNPVFHISHLTLYKGIPTRIIYPNGDVEELHASDLTQTQYEYSIEGKDFTSDPEVVIESDNENDNLHSSASDVIKSILKCRERRVHDSNARRPTRTFEYLVKFKNKPVFENKWVPIEVVKCYPELLAAFDANPIF
jgi:hypothetical protein